MHVGVLPRQLDLLVWLLVGSQSVTGKAMRQAPFCQRAILDQYSDMRNKIPRTERE